MKKHFLNFLFFFVTLFPLKAMENLETDDFFPQKESTSYSPFLHSYHDDLIKNNLSLERVANKIKTSKKHNEAWQLIYEQLLITEVEIKRKIDLEEKKISDQDRFFEEPHTVKKQKTHLAYVWTLWDIHMSRAAEFSPMIGQWNKWANCLKEYTLNGFQGFFFKPLMLASLGNFEEGVKVENYIRSLDPPVVIALKKARGQFRQMVRRYGVSIFTYDAHKSSVS